MNSPIDPRTLTPSQHAALFDEARRRASALRNAAIAEAFAALWRLATMGQPASAAHKTSARAPAARPC